MVLGKYSKFVRRGSLVRIGASSLSRAGFLDLRNSRYILCICKSIRRCYFDSTKSKYGYLTYPESLATMIQKR